MAEHWTPLRKAKLVENVAFGRVDRGEALAAYEISEEEFSAWECYFKNGGAPALRTGRATPQRALPPREEPAPWPSAQAPATLKELSDWFTSQAQLCLRLAATYGREGRLLLDTGDLRRGLERLDFAESIAVQARSYEHAARLSADLAGAPA